MRVQGPLLDDPTSGHIDQHRAIFHEFQLSRTYQPEGLGGEGECEDQVVRVSKDLLQVVESADEVHWLCCFTGPVDSHDFHVKGLAATGDGLSHVPKSHHAQDPLAKGQVYGPSIECTGSNGAGVHHDVLGRRHQERERVFGNVMGTSSGTGAHSHVRSKDLWWEMIGSREKSLNHSQRIHPPDA